MSLLLQVAALVLFLVAFAFGAETIKGFEVDELDWVALGLACWVASGLVGLAPRRGA